VTAAALPEPAEGGAVLPHEASRERAAEALRRSTGSLSTAAMSRMLTDMPWFAELTAESRSWVGQILQAGIKGFVDWFRLGDDAAAPGDTAAAVFGAAPRTLTGVITLGQMTMYLLLFKQGQAAVSAILSAVGGMYEDNLYLLTLYEYLEKHGDDDDALTQSLKASAANIEKAIAARDANAAAASPKNF